MQGPPCQEMVLITKTTHFTPLEPKLLQNNRKCLNLINKL